MPYPVDTVQGVYNDNTTSANIPYEMLRVKKKYNAADAVATKDTSGGGSGGSYDE